jgi:catechol 2,3-dioxygenase-like lactoylglutathione lyase family enzyme
MTGSAVQSGHVGLNVTDLERSIHFYTRALDLEVLSERTRGGERYAFLAFAGELMLTLWQQSKGHFATERPGLHHLSFEVPDLEAVRQAELRLRELGATLHYDGIVRHHPGGASAGIFFSDPDGIRLEIYAPSGAGLETAAAHSTQPACGFF